MLSAFDADASLDVLDHPVLNLIYYMVCNVSFSRLLGYTLSLLESLSL